MGVPNFLFKKRTYVDQKILTVLELYLVELTKELIK